MRSRPWRSGEAMRKRMKERIKKLLMSAMWMVLGLCWKWKWKWKRNVVETRKTEKEDGMCE